MKPLALALALLWLTPALARCPEDYFVTQYRSYANVRGSDNNVFCGAATLAMVALAYDRLPDDIEASQRQELILWCHQRMADDPNEPGIRARGMLRAASLLGLNSRLVRGLEQIQQEVDQGRLVAVAGNVLRLGLPCRGHGGHCMLVVGRKGDDFLINDPGGFFRQPATPISAQDLQKFLWYGVSFWTAST